MSGRLEALETDLVKTKQELGESMNAVNEYELKNIALRDQLEKAMTLKAQAEAAGAKKKGRK